MKTAMSKFTYNLGWNISECNYIWLATIRLGIILFEKKTFLIVSAAAKCDK